MEEKQFKDGANHLSGLELIAAVDGELVDEEIAQHLHHCDLCAQRLMTLRSIQRALRRRLYRALCPTTDQLIDYCQGLLAPSQQDAIAHHLTSCPYCRSEVELLLQRDPLIDRLLLSHLFDGQGFRFWR